VSLTNPREYQKGFLVANQRTVLDCRVVEAHDRARLLQVVLKARHRYRQDLEAAVGALGRAYLDKATSGLAWLQQATRVSNLAAHPDDYVLEAELGWYQGLDVCKEAMA
jgi:hypothetical protein